MEAFELVLILLACVIVASVVEQFVKRISLPLVQIAIGLIVALLIPYVAKIHVESQLFLVLFVAPLLFNEARESNRRALWDNLPPILSLAVGLVLITMLVVGFALHWLVPSIPLAAAFACAAALGPTDAAAVGALGQAVSLSKRQKILLSGESLINDASGVVCFQFAIAAAITGTFSIAQASATFAVLFLGGVVFGVIAGFAAFLSITALRRRGFENNIVHVLYEVFTPFLVFLVADKLHVSGILAVVAAGLVMARHKPLLTTSSQARLNLVSNGFWEIIVYLINGAIFVLLGMQLPQAMSPTINGGFDPFQLIAIILAITSLVMLSRFVWVSATELLHRDPRTGERGATSIAKTLKEALVTTIAGPKGTITLSIIFTIPLSIEGGAAFPGRNVIIFVTAGVILCTLVIADLTLVRLFPNEHAGATEDDIRNAEITVLQNTIKELESKIAMGTHPEYEPATRSVIGGYRTRLNRARLETAEYGDITGKLIKEVREVQQKRAETLQAEIEQHISKSEAAPYYELLRRVRSSVGHYEKSISIGTRPSSLRGKYHAFMLRLRPREVTDERAELMYYQTCLFAIDMENAAIEHLENVAKNADVTTEKVARALIDEYRGIEKTLQERVGYTGEQPGVDAGKLFNRAPGKLSEKFRLARTYSTMITAAALSIELDKIGELQATGAIGEDIAQKLRRNVYVLQMNAEE